MTALYCDPSALAEILRERQDSYEFAARGSVAYFSRLLDFGAWLTELRGECAHGVWMKTLKTAGWSYSVCNRSMKLHRSGVSAAELSLEGGKAVLKRLARPRKLAEAGEAEFGAGVNFDPSPEAAPEGADVDPADTGSGGAAGTGGPAEPPARVEREAGEAEFGAGAKFDEPAEAPAQPVKRAWDAVRERLREAVGETAFDAWLAGLGMEARGTGVVLLAPSAFIRDRVRQDHGERIARFLEQELPGVALEYGVAEAAPAPELALPEGAAADPEARLYMVPEPEKFDPKMAGDRMASCMMLHDIKDVAARAFLSFIAYRDGPNIDGWVVTVRELQAIFGVPARRIQRWTEKCREAGYLQVVPRRNRANRYHAFPSGLDYPRQHRMTLLRIMDLNREAAAREAAESAAARPSAGDGHDTSGATPAAARGDSHDTPMGDGHDTLNPKETDNETAPSRRPPSQALAAGRRR